MFFWYVKVSFSFCKKRLKLMRHASIIIGRLLCFCILCPTELIFSKINNLIIRPKGGISFVQKAGFHSSKRRDFIRPKGRVSFVQKAGFHSSKRQSFICPYLPLLLRQSMHEVLQVSFCHRYQ